MKKNVLLILTGGALFIMGFKIQEKLGNKPFKIYQEGKSKVVVWENKTDKVWYNYQVEKEYKNGSETKYTNSFNETELQDLKVALDKAILDIQKK